MSLSPTPSATPARDTTDARVWTWLLILITAVWGWTFVAIHDAVETMHPSTFVAYRFLAAALVMVAWLLPALRSMTGRELRGGLLAGCALFAAYAAQTLGLTSTTPSNTAFITGLSVVAVPLLAFVVFREQPWVRQLIGIAVAVAGLALLTMRSFAVHGGDLLVLLCAVALAAHVLILSRVSPGAHAGRLTLVQLATVGVLGAAWSASAGQVSAPATGGVWVALIVCAVVASAFAYFVQTKAQAAAVPPTRVAIIFTLEPVFGGVFGYWLAGDRFTPLNIVGAVLILVAMLVTELPARRSRSADPEPTTDRPTVTEEAT